MKAAIKHQIALEISEAPKNSFLLVSSQYADYFRPPPNDGRTYIVQNLRRPWLKHVSGPGIDYTLDEQNPKHRVTSYVNGVRVESKYTAKTLPKLATQSKQVVGSSTDAPPIRLIGIKRVEHITGFGKSYIYENSGISFPQRISFGISKRAAARWIEIEVVAWAKQQASTRTATN